MTLISHPATLNQTKMIETFSRLVEAIVAKVRKFIDRVAMKASLEKLSDNHLRDIGLTRNDVSPIPHTPLPSNGALARPGNW
jgi:uncharacterized protein YjiS (DUF1127 family)